MKLRFPVRVLLIASLLYVAARLSAGDELSASARADRVLVLKRERKLVLLANGRMLKTYRIALGGDPLGPKEREGDHQTLEGIYVLDRRNPKSRFYRSIHNSYPDAKDRARAQQLGVPAGGDIMIHGLPNRYRWVGNAHRLHDWTDGCIAVTDKEMDEIWRAVPDGTPIEIRP